MYCCVHTQQFSILKCKLDSYINTNKQGILISHTINKNFTSFITKLYNSYHKDSGHNENFKIVIQTGI